MTKARIAVLLVVALLVGCGRAARDGVGTRFICPMHPSVISDQPGDCPVCNMRLVPAPEAVAVEGSGQARFKCPMDPEVSSDRPGDCSKCGMPLELETVPAVDDRAAVRLSGERRQLAGAATSPVERVAFRRTIRAPGRVEVDETRRRLIHPKTAGYVELLHANATGTLVRAGEPLLELYSPELVAAQQEFLVALRAQERGDAGDAGGLVASARRRLELLDLSAAQIAALESSREARRTVTVAAPISGTILRRGITQGERVTPEMPIVEIADLSRVWVVAAVYEHELPYVRAGQDATVSLSYLPGQAFRARVDLVLPVLDPATRTAQVRLAVDNAGGALRPEMFAEVTLAADLGERLSVPDAAVLDTGPRALVFREEGDGLFVPREVALGLRAPGRVEILAGLTAGDRVLSSGNFLVDAESKLGADLAGHAGHAGHGP
jgi:RND family efflux transporter MFP subunit